LTERVVVRRGTYHDSVTLMLVSRDAEELDGVEFAAAVTATDTNRAMLSDNGFTLPPDIGPDDLVVVVRAADDSVADAAVAQVEERLGAPVAERAGSVDEPPRSLRSAARRDRDLNVAFVSVPGRHAAYEVALALEAGLHVFCFSDGMSLADEAALKRRAVDAGLLFMGADCGTAIIDGVALGFANAVRRGPVGIVGASGTGIQQVSCLLDAAGVGVSHAIGVGGRDLSETVGGLMTEHALRLLADDPSTEVICVLSKPPHPEVARRIVDAVAKTGKPAVVGFLGQPDDSLEVVFSLEEAAARAAELSGGHVRMHDVDLPSASSPGQIRGLFCGGSLCFEAEAVTGSEFIDFGADEYTQGRAHPMIDPTLRNHAFVEAAADDSVGAVVLDVVLGFGAHPDPAGDLAPLIERALGRRELTVAVALCGAAGDPQGTEDQRTRLERAGAIVSRNAAHAARVALAAVGAGER
jgi:FdrA protein